MCCMPPFYIPYRHKSTTTPTCMLPILAFYLISHKSLVRKGLRSRGRARPNPLSDKELRRRSTTLPSNAATVKLDRRLEAVAVVRVPLCLDFHLATNPVTKHARRQCRDGCNRFADCPTVSVLRTAQLLPLFVGVDDCFGVSHCVALLPLCCTPPL